MTIGVIQASSQRDKNTVLYRETLRAAKSRGDDVVNFGVFPEEEEAYSYVQVAVCVSLLLESKAVDFVITGCSSGTGMMLACNSLPGVLCGYINNPTEAYLFGRINDGNAISFPLGLGFGWAGEMNLRFTLEKLFQEPMGAGYPKEDAERKRRDTLILKGMKAASHRKLVEVLKDLDREYLRPALARKEFCAYLLEMGKDQEIRNYMKEIVY